MTDYFTNAPHNIIFKVGKKIKQFVDDLQTRHLKLETPKQRKDHLRDNWQAAGHSLGAQTLGAFAYTMQKDEKDDKYMLGVIYGLDPAGIMFTYRPKGSKLDEFFHLEKGHAHRLLFIHTEWKDRGMKHAVADYDYYLFGPIGDNLNKDSKDDQPGCDSTKFNQKSNSCNHQRALNVFKYSLRHHSLRHDTPKNTEDDIDNLVTGFKCVIGQDGHSGHVDKAQISIFGINHDFGHVIEGSNHVYFIPSAGCPPYTQIKGKPDILPRDCKRHVESQYGKNAIKPDKEVEYYTFVYA